MKKASYHAELLGTEIRCIRENAEFSQEELSWKTGISRSQIGRIERGECEPQDYNLRLIEDALGLVPHYLDRIRGDLIVDERIDRVFAKMKEDVLSRDLTDKSINLLAHMTSAIADVLEEWQE